MKHNGILEQIVEIGLELQYAKQLSSILPDMCDISGSLENKESWNIYIYLTVRFKLVLSRKKNVSCL